MKLTIRQKNLEITEPLRVYIESKLITPLKKIVGDEERYILDIECERTTRHHRKGGVFRAEANFQMGKTRVRAEATAEDIRAAIDLVEEELKREVKKIKGKTKTLGKRIGLKIKQESRFSESA